VEFRLFIAASLSLSLFWSPQSQFPLWLSSTANERTNAPNRPLCDISLLSLPSSVLYYECDITLPRLFGSDKPASNQYHLHTSAFSHFFPTSCRCFTKHYDPLHSITPPLPTYLSLRLSFYLPFPLTLLLLGVAKLVR